MALTTDKNFYSPFAYDDALIEDLQTMDDYVFYKEHDEEFDYYEQHLSNSDCSRYKKTGNGRYKKLKCSLDEQIRYAEKMAVKRVNAERKKINDMYARNRRDARSAVIQETKEEPVFDEVDTIVKESLWDFDKVDTIVKDSYWDFDKEIDWIEKELIRCQYGAVVYQKLFGGPLEGRMSDDGVDTYYYKYI